LGSGQATPFGHRGWPGHPHLAKIGKQINFNYWTRRAALTLRSSLSHFFGKATQLAQFKEANEDCCVFVFYYLQSVNDRAFLSHCCSGSVVKGRTHASWLDACDRGLIVPASAAMQSCEQIDLPQCPYCSTPKKRANRRFYVWGCP
jgi:hypothetical protein